MKTNISAAFLASLIIILVLSVPLPAFAYVCQGTCAFCGIGDWQNNNCKLAFISGDHIACGRAACTYGSGPDTQAANLKYAYTSTGNDIAVDIDLSPTISNTATVTFSAVTSEGTVTIGLMPLSGPYSSPPPGFSLLAPYYVISTEATNADDIYTGDITVTVPYVADNLTDEQQNDLKLFHWQKNGVGNYEWKDVNVSVDMINHTITGKVTSLSPFGIGTPLPPTGVNTYELVILAFLSLITGTIFVIGGRVKRAGATSPPGSL